MADELISELSKDKWKQVKATFTAQGEYLVLNVKNGSSIYFDGIVVRETLFTANGSLIATVIFITR